MSIKRISKIAAIVLIIMMLFTIIQPVFAAINLSTLKPLYKETGDLATKAGNIMGLIRNIAIVVGVIMLMIIGVKFMLGSAEEKAEYKKSLMPLVIGIVIVMTATTLVTLVYNFAKA